jgi:hypothetical protein
MPERKSVVLEPGASPDGRADGAYAREQLVADRTGARNPATAGTGHVVAGPAAGVPPALRRVLVLTPLLREPQETAARAWLTGRPAVWSSHAQKAA